jgi:hypothetical protein
MRLTTLAVLFLVVVAMVVPAEGYQVIQGHPRLFFTASQVSGIRSRALGSYSADYNKIKTWCDSHINDPLPVNVSWALSSYSFVYLVSQDTSYLNRAKAVASYVISHNQTHSTDWIFGGSVFFDWCYDGLTASERSTYGSALADGADWYQSGSGIGTQWSSLNNYHSKLGRIALLSYPGIALYGEGINNQVATACLDTYSAHQFGSSTILCCLDEIASDGGYFEGDYNMSILCTGNRMGMTAYDVGTTDDPFSWSTNYQNMARYLVYDTGAAKGSGTSLGSKQGDSHWHSGGSGAVRMALYNLAAVYNDGVAQWVADEVLEQGSGYINSFDRWKQIVWRDPSVTPVHPSAVYGDNSAALFNDVGMVYMRSGWDLSVNSTDIYAVFRCEAVPSYHTHSHQGHFLIARGNDLLAIDSGDYDSSISSHHQNYFCRTIAHNTITVYDPGESTFYPYANDGGQIPVWSYPDAVVCGDMSGPEFDRGSIVTPYRDTETFTYVKGDATKAYSSHKLSNFTREFVWLKPDFFVVLDRVTATSPSFTKKWLLHSINQPQVSGDTFSVTQGDSRLFVKTLLPTQHQITPVGGSGRQFEVNGVNYPPAGGGGSESGSWRVEVSPSTAANEHMFLHVLYATSSGVSSMPNVTFIDTGDFIGANVAGQTVLFTKSGQPGEDACWVSGG